MKNAWHQILRSIRVVAWVGIAASAAVFALGGRFFTMGEQQQDPWVWCMEALESRWLEVGLVAIGLLLVEAGYWLSRPRSGRRSENLVIKQPSGEVTVALRTVRNELVRLADASADIVSMEPEVFPTRKGMDLELNVSLDSRCSVPDVCRVLQDQARQWVAEHMGEARTGQVRINVRELVHDSANPEFAPPPAAKRAAPSPAPAVAPSPAPAAAPIPAPTADAYEGPDADSDSPWQSPPGSGVGRAEDEDPETWRGGGGV